MKTALFLCLFATGALATPPPIPVTAPHTNVVLALDWTPPTNLTGITGYIIRHGTAPGTFIDQMAVPGASSTNTYWSNAVLGVTHYFTAYSVNTVGLESDPSNVAQVALDPRPSPPQLRQAVPLVVVIESRPTTDDPWVERLRFGPFDALASMEGEMFRVSLQVDRPTPVLPEP